METEADPQSYSLSWQTPGPAMQKQPLKIPSIPRLSLKNTYNRLFISACLSNTSFAPLGSKAVIAILRQGVSAQRRPLPLCPSHTSETHTGPLRVVALIKTVFLTICSPIRLLHQKSIKIYPRINLLFLCLLRQQ